MNVEELLKMILDDIKVQGHITYSDEIAIRMIDNCREIMRHALEKCKFLFVIISNHDMSICFLERIENYPDRLKHINRVRRFNG